MAFEIPSKMSNDVAEAFRKIAKAELENATSLVLYDLNITDAILLHLSKLTSLKMLDLSENDQLSDLSPLTRLVALEGLELNGSEGRLSDLSPLNSLPSLKSLSLCRWHGLRDLSPLMSLVSLERLALGICDQLKELKPLVSLPALSSLLLYGCKMLTQLDPIAHMVALKYLDLEDCSGVADFSPILQHLPTLDFLCIKGCSFQDIPPEICGEEFDQNVIKEVRAHFADRLQGEVDDNEVKVILIGNGSAGKTQLSRILRGLKFDETIPSTHGIQLESTSWKLDGRDIRLNLWDFGGQEIYHGTHSLFIQGRAIYLLVWNPELESAAPYLENHVPMRHRPLSYWLDYLRGYAGDGDLLTVTAPVLVIQSKCDDPEAIVECPPTGDTQDFNFLKTEQISAKEELYLDEVRAALTKALRQVLTRHKPIPIGIGRARVRDRLRALLNQDRESYRILKRSDFDRICDEDGGISNKDAFLDYLHLTGVLFHRPGLFSGRIILDQNWALQAIYTLFDRTATLPLLKDMGGRFTRPLLERLAWSQYTRPEQEIFLGMMQSCGICFRGRSLRDDEWEYIAPELLPGWSEASHQLLIAQQSLAPSAEVEARFQFLHEGILRNYLSRIGEQAKDSATYWRYGFAFREETSNTTVLVQSSWNDPEAQSGPGSIQLRAWGSGAQDILQSLLAELKRLPIGQKPEILWPNQPEPPKSPKGDLFSQPEGKDLAKLTIAPVNTAPTDAPEVYISYSWGDNLSEAGRRRDEIADGVCACARSEGWIVRRDRDEARPGASISEFMNRIYHGALVIVILSERYLERERCMAELNGIFLDARSDEAEFRSRIIAVGLDDARIASISDRIKVAKYWNAEVKQIEPDLAYVGPKDFAKYHSMKGWYLQIGEILHYIDDTINPWGYERIIKDDYSSLREILQSRRTKSSSASPK